MDAEQVAIKLTGDSSSLQDAMSSAVKELDIFGIKIGDVSKILGVGMLAGAAKVAADALGEMIGEFAEDEAAALKFNAAIESSTKLLPGAAERLDVLALSFASMTGEANSAAQEMIAMLVATGRTEQEIAKMLNAAQGMSAVLGVDVNTALTQLNQTFSGTSGRLAKTTPELASLTEEAMKNGAAVDVMNEKYGGFSSALQNSTDVSIKNFKNAWGEVSSLMGSVAEKDLKYIRDGLTEFATFLSQNEDVMIGVFNGIKIAVIALAAAMGPVTAVIAGIGLVVAAIADHVGRVKKETADAIAEANKGAQAMTDRWVAMGKAFENSGKKLSAEEQKILDELVKKRKEAEEKYRSEIEQTETRQKLGLNSEKDAIEEKRKANQKFVDDLIKLGYTGAEKSEQIGDKSLRSALERITQLNEAERSAVDTRSEIVNELSDLQEEQKERRLATVEAEKAELDRIREEELAAEREASETEKALAEDTAYFGISVQDTAKNAAINSDKEITEMRKQQKDLRVLTAEEEAEKQKQIAALTTEAIKKGAEEYSKTFKEEAKKVETAYSQVFTSVSGILNALSDSISANSAKRIAEIEQEEDAVKQRYDSERKLIDDQYAAEVAAINAEKESQLAAAGILSGRAKIADDLAKAEAEGNTEKADALKKDLARYDIEKEASDKLLRVKQEADDKRRLAAQREVAELLNLERQKADIKYKADLAQYEINMALAVGQAALAIIQGYAQLGPVAGSAAALATGVVTLLNIDTMSKNKPQPPQFAIGGIADGLAWVGEQGPELVSLPRGSEVMPAHDSERMAKQGSTQVFNFYSPVALDAGEIETQQRRALRELAFEGVLI